MKMCKGAKPVVHGRTEMIPGHIYTCTASEHLRMCVADFEQKRIMVCLVQGKVSNGNLSSYDEQYTDVTDQYCIKKNSD